MSAESTGEECEACGLIDAMAELLRVAWRKKLVLIFAVGQVRGLEWLTGRRDWE